MSALRSAAERARRERPGADRCEGAGGSGSWPPDEYGRRASAKAEGGGDRRQRLVKRQGKGRPHGRRRPRGGQKAGKNNVRPAGRPPPLPPPPPPQGRRLAP